MKRDSSDPTGLNIDQILKILPHQYPFVLVDRVLKIEHGPTSGRVGRKIKALKNVTINEPHFTGHFPGKPIMPGVLILEALAQAGALACFMPEDPLRSVAIARIGESRIRRPVIPGDQLLLEAEVIKERSHMIEIVCKASVDGQLVTEVKVLASVNA